MKSLPSDKCSRNETRTTPNTSSYSKSTGHSSHEPFFLFAKPTRTIQRSLLPTGAASLASRAKGLKSDWTNVYRTTNMTLGTTQRRTTSDEVSSRRPSPNSEFKSSRKRDETASDLRARSMTYSVATQYTHFERTADIQAIITRIAPIKSPGKQSQHTATQEIDGARGIQRELRFASPGC